ncbi:MAG: DoxX family protein [Streptosporangiales bacterium]|nr:DoxX family protein [Streptosporangiales bacterium]
MNIALWVVAGILAAMFLLAGVMKIVTPKERLESTIMVWAKGWTRPQLRALGAVEVLGAAGLILPRALNIVPVLTPVAAFGCAVVMIGAAIVHARMKDYKGIGMPVVLLILAAVVAVGRR